MEKKLQNHSIIEVAILNISLFVFLFFPEWLTEKVKNQLQIHNKAFNNQIFRKKLGPGRLGGVSGFFVFSQ